MWLACAAAVSRRVAPKKGARANKNGPGGEKSALRKKIPPLGIKGGGLKNIAPQANIIPPGAFIYAGTAVQYF